MRSSCRPATRPASQEAGRSREPTARHAAGRRERARKGCADVQFDVEVNGRIRRVRVNRAQSGYLVAVDDRDWTIDVARIDAQTLSILMGTSSYDVSIVTGPAAD